MDGFREIEIDGGGVEIFARVGGSGLPLLLLHGFPEAHLMWRGVAPLLADSFTLVCADLPGYGRSGMPAITPDHANHSKRGMAATLVRAMERLGYHNAFVAGHDRGGRVAYRMALDHPDRIRGAAVLDIVPTETVWAQADAGLALGFWPWSLLAQPAPLPENILTSAAATIVDHALSRWGSNAANFPREVRLNYIEALQCPERARAICEEYRAAAGIDREHDRADLASGRRIECPLLVLWSKYGAVDTWYADEGGPLEIWRAWAADVEGHGVDGGHFSMRPRPTRLPLP